MLNGGNPVVARWIKRLFLILVIIAGFIASPLAFPGPLFAYGVTDGKLSVYADKPIPEIQAKAFIRDVEQRLTKIPALQTDHPMKIYIANEKWRQRLLWLIVPYRAGGFVVTPVSNWHAFFSGADFLSDRLISRSGYRPEPPRTLGYYGAHELTHVVMSKKLGWVRFLLLPKWIREGMADYVAMPDESADKLFMKIGKKKADLPMMKTYGVYAPFRLLVAFFLENQHWSADRLMASDLSFDQARKIVFAALEQ